ncbi:hypothetical protein HDU76_006363 [Blyttiomyces sp. JEL0837]|nr:hypothetical protein HDU76_006363 [Blyttiomyces sp. JEL0837]
MIEEGDELLGNLPMPSVMKQPSRRMSLADAFSNSRRTSSIAKRPPMVGITFHEPQRGSISINESVREAPPDSFAKPVPEPNIGKRKPGRFGAIDIIQQLQVTEHGGPESRRTSTNMRDPDHEAFLTQSEPPLTVESSVSEFRSMHQEIPHPATVLNLVADESDREIYSEFDNLCNEVLSSIGDFEASLEEMTIWKDDFLTQTVPSNVKLQLTMMFARLFRSKSELHEPLFELLKQVRLYSRPWANKRFALLELEKDYQRTTVIETTIRSRKQSEAPTASRAQSANHARVQEERTRKKSVQHSRRGTVISEQSVASDVPVEPTVEKGIVKNVECLLRPSGEARWQTEIQTPKRLQPSEIVKVDLDSEIDSFSEIMEDDDDSAFSDFEYISDVEESAIKESLAKFVDESRVEAGLHFDNGAVVDSRKGWFSLQDVMELTLLHAQQMQLLQAEYEERLHQTESALEESRKALQEAEAEHESRLKQAQERVQRLAREYMKTVNDAPAAGETGTEDNLDQSDLEDRPETPKKDVSKRKKVKKSSKHRRFQREYRPTERHHVQIRRREYVLKKKPKFTSAPFAMNFLERLRWFTAEKLKKRTEIRERLTAIEVAANELRLQHLKLIRRSEVMDAEFVPYPGQVPHLRRDIWAEQGIHMPWGGRFQSRGNQQHGAKDPEKLNILNLFDVAIRTSPSPKPPPS